MSVTTIVVGTDGSEGAARSVEWAAELAASLEARVVVVHAFEPLAMVGLVEPPVDFAALRQQARSLLETEWVQPLVERGVAFDTVLAEGHAPDVLADTAEDRGADLIVVGARGLGSVRGLLLGSTSARLPHVTGLPVTIVPAPQ